MNLKALYEQRNAKIEEIRSIVNLATEETRAMTEEENGKYNTLKTEIEGLNETISAAEEARSFEGKGYKAGGNDKNSNENKEEEEHRAFENYLRGMLEETRSGATAVNLTKSDNGAVIPSSIAKKIIDKVVEISPVYQKATKYNIGGTLTIPVYNTSTGDITVSYADEFTALTSTSGKFTNITLTGYLIGALTKISKSLINNSNFDIVSFAINKIAEKVALWIENELFHGTNNKIRGLADISATQTVTAASATAVTADELIDIQEAVPDVFQRNAIWVMSRTTRKAIRKLKDGQDNYLLEKDATAKWGYSLFGKDVYVSDGIDEMAAGKLAVAYGDFSGLAVKLSEDLSIEVLREKYADEHAVGVVAWAELDSKIENEQKLAVLKMKAS